MSTGFSSRYLPAFPPTRLEGRAQLLPQTRGLLHTALHHVPEASPNKAVPSFWQCSVHAQNETTQNPLAEEYTVQSTLKYPVSTWKQTSTYKIRLVLTQFWTLRLRCSEYADLFSPWKNEVREECRKPYQSSVVKSIFYSVSKLKS